MIGSNNDTGRKIKEDKYKILRMSLILGNTANDKDSIDDFETSSREIDAMNQDVYTDSLNSKYYKTSTLEEEKVRLKDLISFIEGRLAQRDALEEDFYNITGVPLTDLAPIKDGDRLSEYRNRLKYIERYLSNMNNIEKINKELDEYHRELSNACTSKENSEQNNVNIEKEVLNLFRDLVDDNSIILKKIGEIEKELKELNLSIIESKRTLDIFNKSFKSLKKAGISGREEKEYHAYVSNAREDYYEKMEKYFLLSLYKLLLDINDKYEDLFDKRNKIKDLLADRTNLRAELEIVDIDNLSKLYDVLDEQYEDIKLQKENIDRISSLKDIIKDKEEQLESYKADNQKVEILSLLREFSLVDDVKKEEKKELEVEEHVDKEEIDNDMLDDYALNLELKQKVEHVADNMVIDVQDATGIDIVSVTNKAKSVMLRVGKMLNPDSNKKKVVTPTRSYYDKPEVSKKEEIKPVNEEDNVNQYMMDRSSSMNVNSSRSEIKKVNNSSFDTSIDSELELPKFDDLPTVSSLTSKNNTDNKSNDNLLADSFWGNDTSDFEFPDINKWGND